jgi:hypothetical protein
MRVEYLLLLVKVAGTLTVIEEDLIKDKLSQYLLVKRILLKLQVEVVDDRLLSLKFDLMKWLPTRCLGLRIAWLFLERGQTLEVGVSHRFEG